MSHCCLPNQKKLPFGFLLAKTKFFSVSFGLVGLEDLSQLDDLFRPFSGGRKDRGDWMVLFLRWGLLPSLPCSCSKVVVIPGDAQGMNW